MTFEFTVQPGFNFIKSFGDYFNIPVFRNELKIPPHMGEGHIKTVDVEPGFKFVLHHYTLKEGFHLKRNSPDEAGDLISIVFNSNELPAGSAVDRETAVEFLKKNGSSILVASTETIFPANAEIYFGVIGIKRQVLADLLRVNQANGPLEAI